MTTTAISLLFNALVLELLFAIGSGVLLLLRRGDASPSGGRMRLLWAAVFLISLIPLRIIPPTAEMTIYEENAAQEVYIRFTEYDLSEEGESPAPDSAEAVPAPSKTEAEPAAFAPVTIRLRASSAEAIQALLGILCCVWLIGTAASLIARLGEYSAAASLLRAHSSPCTDSRMLALYRQAGADLNMKTPPPLRIFERGTVLSPCCTGIFRPSVCISESQGKMSDHALYLIFVHELTHIRMRDSLLALLCTLVCSFHWMNPLCERVTRALGEDCELNCDAHVLRVCGGDSRLPYIHTILDIASGTAAHAAATGSYFAAATPGADFIKRRYDTMKNRKNGRLTTILAIFMTALLLLSNMLLLSACSATDADSSPANTAAKNSPKVSLQNSLLATAISEYFGVAPEELTEAHMTQIRSLEIRPSTMEYEFDETLTPIRIRINDGKVLTASGEKTVTMKGELYTEGYVFETLPLMMDRSKLDALIGQIQATDAWNASKLAAFYALKDASPARLEEMAYTTLLVQLSESDRTDSVQIDTLYDINGDGTADARDLAAIGAARSYEEAQALVDQMKAEMSAEEWQSFLLSYVEQAKAEMLAHHPYAEERPMYLLDPYTKPREIRSLMSLFHGAGLLEGRALRGTEIDLADTALMPNLEKLTLDPAFTAQNLPK